jgi:leucyl aminopeptidase (aminopeptidase T)
MFPALDVDYANMQERINELVELLSKASNAKISAQGTELEMSLEGRGGIADTGILTEKGTMDNLPAGEACIAPLEGTAKGYYSSKYVSSFGVAPTKFIVKNGFIIDVECENEKMKKELEELFKENRNNANIAEFGIGANPKAKLMGNPLEDEKVLGTVHIAFGDNATIGGNVEADIHLDVIIEKPTVWLDNEKIIEKGKLCYPKKP